MRLIGRYELRERIGEGAMAEVWRAHDPSIDRVLAIKLLKQEYRRNPEYAMRFLREAKAAGALAHPSIVTIYDVGEADGYPYIAMELLEGESLDQVLAREGQLSGDRVLAIGGQLAAALSYAHLSGVVHRDIKPSNIMLGRDGTSIKILDFGIARVAEDAAFTDQEHVRTQIGQVLGTPRYMSPEQALGQVVDGRSDLFSVGVVLYELITGKQAFSGTSAATLALQITQQNPPSIATVEPGCPGGLRFIVEKLLAKRPERRFADGAELARALAREAKAYEAVHAEDSARRKYLPLQIRLTLGMVAVTAIALAISVSAVLDRQYRAMERMALASGSSISAFVASNAALPSVENSAALPMEQDWTPIQAFIAAAAKDQSVRWMTMVDAEGIIRGASDPKLLGARYRPPVGEVVVQRNRHVTVTDIKLDDGRDGFRFVHPILYADRKFGMIEVSISKAELQAAADTSRNLMLALSTLILLVVGMISFTLAKMLAAPVRRLKQALRDATMGDLDFRISHGRKDEFGELFDGFNLFATAVQERLEAAERPSGGPRALDETRIAPTVAEAQPKPAPVQPSSAEGTPFDPAWPRRSA
ncbi:MAG: protein kinase [Phenylobacterium sp.]|uniref:protein kinase domain-containing protein n=1 Tax=Phenylobacterium sp. TaxID=1871053 RepID=UPI002730E4D9|nr:protein kinase [Phenylobacterium sp.]MDP2011518.1 protein kinase [Phenylobacterium sp.]